MIDFLLSLIPVCLGIWCIHILFQEGHLFEEQGKWITNKLGKKWSKPIINCAVCMSSIYGVIGFFALRYFFDIQLPLKQLIPYVLCLCGLNTLLSKLTTKERIIIEDE
jgi:hypothetical protein